jgi:tetratricopeptide (TPR) repeat protein
MILDVPGTSDISYDLFDAGMKNPPIPTLPILAAALLAMHGVVPGALAQPVPSSRPATRPASEREALELYRRGLTHYNLAQYDEAIALFKRAYLVSRAPELLFNIAQAYRLKGPESCSLALRFYRSYLREEPKARGLASVQAVIADMERCVRERAAAAPPGSRPSTQPASAPADRADRPAQPPARWWPAALVAGTGVALAAGGGALLGWVRAEYDDLEQSCAPACDPGRVDGLRRAHTAGWVLAGVGAAAVVGGLITWALVRRARIEAASSTWVAPLRGGAAVGIRF